MNTSNRLTEKQKQFFVNFCNYTGEELYFYGSIKRMDYIQGKSDIDTDIFTSNTVSTIQKICNFLHIPKSDFKKTILKIGNKVVYGSKTMYQSKEYDVKVEISVFNEKYKELVLQEHQVKGSNLKPHVTFSLYIIKIMYYILGIISPTYYSRIKNFLINSSEPKFVALDNNLN